MVSYSPYQTPHRLDVDVYVALKLYSIGPGGAWARFLLHLFGPLVALRTKVFVQAVLHMVLNIGSCLFSCVASLAT